MQMDFLVKDTYADLVRGNPHVTRVLAFPANGTLSELLELRRRVRRERYDLILDIHDSLRSRLLCAGAAEVRRVNKRKLARFALVHFKKDLYRWFGGAPGVAERYLETVRGLGVEDDGLGPELFLPPEAAVRAGEILEEAGLGAGQMAIGLCPSARHFTKIWPAIRFVEAGAALASRHGAPVVVFGGDEEADRCREIAAAVNRRSGFPAVTAAGRTSLLETAAIMDRCAVVVTNDTGLMHLASARGRPVVAVFGSTTRQLGFFPQGGNSRVVEHASLSCRPCTHIGRQRCPLRHFRCMLEISPALVVDAAESVWAGAASAAPDRRRSS